MKNLERILAENMLRFNPKNLSATEKYNLQRLIAEQDFRTTAPVATAATGDIKSYINNAQCVFKKTAFEEKLSPVEVPISAEFYNNMVTLDKGLMPNTSNVEAKIKEIVAACTGPTFNGKEFKITITGQATTANPGMKGKDGGPLDHPGGKPYAGLDISQADNKQPGNMYLAKQRAESIKQRLLAALTAAGVNKNLPDLEKRISTEGKVVPGGREAKGARIIKVLVYIPQATNKQVFKDGVFANVNVFYEYTWAQYQLGSAGAWVNNPNPPFKPIIRSGWSITFGVSGAGPDLDFSVAWGGGSSKPGFMGGFSPMNNRPGTIDSNGKLVTGTLHSSQPTPWIPAAWVAQQGKGDIDFVNQPIYNVGSQSGFSVPQSRDAGKKFDQWLQSNGHISKQQWNTLVQKGIIFSILTSAGVSYKKPSELELKINPADLKVNGGTNDAKATMHEADIDIDTLIQLCGGNQKPVLTKTTTPLAIIQDETVTPPTVTQVKDMATDPGELQVI